MRRAQVYRNTFQNTLTYFRGQGILAPEDGQESNNRGRSMIQAAEGC